MKKVIALVSVALLIVGSAFAMDMSIGLKGLSGVDNSDVKGAAVGGGVDINLDLYKGFGIQIEADIITTKLSGGNGLTATENFNVNIPVMAWYNHDFNHFGIGGGLGLGCNISSGVKFTLTGGLEVRYNINEDFALFIGVNGNLDIFPTLAKETSGNQSTYKFVRSDYSKNNIYGSIGLRYNIAFDK